MHNSFQNEKNLDPQNNHDKNKNCTNYDKNNNYKEQNKTNHDNNNHDHSLREEEFQY